MKKMHFEVEGDWGRRRTACGSNTNRRTTVRLDVDCLQCKSTERFKAALPAWDRRSVRLCGGVRYEDVLALVAEVLGVSQDEIRPITENVGNEVARLGVCIGPEGFFSTAVTLVVRSGHKRTPASNREFATTLAQCLQRGVLVNLEEQEWVPGCFLMVAPDGGAMLVNEDEDGEVCRE